MMGGCGEEEEEEGCWFCASSGLGWGGEMQHVGC